MTALSSTLTRQPTLFLFTSIANTVAAMRSRRDEARFYAAVRELDLHMLKDIGVNPRTLVPHVDWDVPRPAAMHVSR